MSGGGIGWESAMGLRLGWTLLHSLWQIALVVGVVAFLLTLIRKSARVRYAVAYGALVLALLVPLATFIGTAPPSQTEVKPFQVVSAPLGTAEPILPETKVPLPSVPQTPILDDVVASPDSPAVTPTSDEVVVETVSWPHMPRFGRMLETTAAWVGPFWLFGVLVLTLRQLGGWWLARNMLAAAESFNDKVLCGIVERLSHRMRIRRRVRVLRSSLAGVPMVLGAFRPVVLVPVSLVTGLPPQQWEAILAHELAHIRRYDFLMNLVQVVIETLLFYHPALWWLSRRVRIERELCCDDVATQYCGTPAILAEALVAIETSRAASPLAVAAVGPAGRHSTVHRVRRLLGLSEFGNRRSTTWLAGVVVLSMVVLGWTLGRVSLGPNEVVAEEAATSDRTNAGDEAAVTQVATEGPGSTTIPAVRATVVDDAGRPVKGAKVRSYTPRDSVRVLPGGRFGRDAHGDTETDSQGSFRLPSRDEHYRILVVHDCGVASMDCKELLRAKRVVVRPWARVEGTVVFDGEPQVGETLVMAFEPSTWSYGKLGRNNLSFRCRAVTDENGRFAFEGVPPLAGMVFRDNAGLYNLTRFEAAHGKTTTLHLGAGHTVIGRLQYTAKSGQEPVDWSTAIVKVSSGCPSLPASFKPDPGVPRGTWLRQWHRTDEGQRWLAKLERDTHQNYIADVASDGSFKVHGVMQGEEYEYTIFVHLKNAPGITLVMPAGRPGAIRTPFKILKETANPLDLGDVLLEPMPAPDSEGPPE